MHDGIPNRIGYIDGLRAVAVLSVVAFHAAIYGHVEQTRLLARIVFQGHRGVELFFVISGFCLSYPTLLALSKGARPTFDIVKFGAKRIVRILPRQSSSCARWNGARASWGYRPSSSIFRSRHSTT